MPKVIIWRDDAVETEFDPAHRDWRIGRSETNDIALLDPRKSVSRFHAELREENGQWYFIDLNSQNGSWSDGQRVTRLLLGHDMEVSFGDYRLVFVDTPRVAAVVPPVPDQDTTATEGGVAAAAAAAADNPDQTLIMPSDRKDDTPTPPAGAPVVRPKAPTAKVRKGVNPIILIVFALAMVGAMAAVGFRIYQSMSDGSDAAPVKNTPAPPVTPEPVAPVPTPEPEPEPAATDEAETAAEATPEPEPAPKAAPKRVSRRPTPPPAPKVPPEVEEQYGAGRRALTAQRFAEATKSFEAVLAAMPGFRDAEALLEQARDGQRQAQVQALADGKRLEAAGEWAPAVAAYERAGATAEAGAARTRMHAAGDDAYRKARQFDAKARAADAIGWYERAVEWLPTTDARRNTARERLTQLKGGDE